MLAVREHALTVREFVTDALEYFACLTFKLVRYGVKESYTGLDFATVVKQCGVCGNRLA